jgi:dihydropteroate synthase
MAVESGATIVRTHDVAETVQALRVAKAIREAR